MIINYELIFGSDKILHFLIFFSLAFIAGVVLLTLINRANLITSLQIVWLHLVAIGLIEEYRQYYLPDRSAELLDAVANLLGVSFGLLFPLAISFSSCKCKKVKRFIIIFLLVLPFFIGLFQLNEEPFFTM